MKKITSKQIFTYVLLICIIAVGAVYMLVYKKNVEETEAVRNNIGGLTQRITNLKVYHDNEAMYLADMEPMKKKIREVLEPYPVDVKEEDIIMQAVYTQLAAPIEFKSINISGETVMTSIGADVVTGAGMEEYQQEIQFIEQGATYPNEVSYADLKVAVQTIFDSDYPIGIKNFVYAKSGASTEGKDDEVDVKLTGTLDLVFYSVAGTGKEYVKPEVLPYTSGTENIFGTSLEK